MVYAYDPGYRSVPVSMAGVKGRPGFGLRVNSYFQTVLAAIPIQMVAPANSKRVALMIQVRDDTNGIQVYMGQFTAPFYMWPHDTFIWDKDFPWTGPIYAIGLTGDSDILVAETDLAGEET